jgi:hypothetical protein
MHFLHDHCSGDYSPKDCILVRICPSKALVVDVAAERLYPSAHFTISQAAVAQWIEYWPPKPRVVGSIPASRTNHRHCPAVRRKFHTYRARNVASRVVATPYHSIVKRSLTCGRKLPSWTAVSKRAAGTGPAAAFCLGVTPQLVVGDTF